VKLIENGKTIVIKKTSLCWLLQNQKEKISTDRLRRFLSVTPQRAIGPSDCSVRMEIYCGNWCCFYENDLFTIGHVVGFSYVKNKGRQQKFHEKFCPIKPPTHIVDPKGVNVIANWFEYDRKTNDLNFVGKPLVINIDTYFTHIEPPIFENELILTESSKTYLQSMIGENIDPLLI
jgi:hypothetical protein